MFKRAELALDILVEMAVLLREERGKYRVHPSVMWRGELVSPAEEATPALTLVTGAQTD